MAATSIATGILDRVFGRRRTIAGKSSVLLTFDDGPHSEVTPAVLDRLREHQARAVFFAVGSRINGSTELLQRIIGEGHLIGNHSFEHRLESDPWPIEYFRDVRRCQATLTELTGRRPRLFRAPMGRRSVGALVTPRLLGLQHLMWSAECGDWQLRSGDAARDAGERLYRSVRPGDIVLLHDDNPWVLTVLDILLPNLVSRGIDLRSAIEML